MHYDNILGFSNLGTLLVFLVSFKAFYIIW